MRSVVLSLRRTAEALKVTEESTKSLTEFGSEVKSAIEGTKVTVSEAKTLLSDAVEARKHAMEYDALASLVLTKPDRRQTEEKRQTLQNELSELKVSVEYFSSCI
jgi:DNA-directed RNA polymerase subunit F